MNHNKKKCQCHFCQYQYPLYKKIESSLTQEAKELINDIWLEAERDSTELGSLQAKLAGTWPNYETFEQRLTLIKPREVDPLGPCDPDSVQF